MGSYLGELLECHVEVVLESTQYVFVKKYKNINPGPADPRYTLSLQTV